MSDLLEWLDAHAHLPRESLIRELGCWLGKSSRVLADEWWHANDLDSAFAWAVRRLSELSIEAVSMEAFDARHEAVSQHVEDEEEQRRHQLGFVATHANARLRDGRRFYCLGA